MVLHMDILDGQSNHSSEHDGACKSQPSSRRESQVTVRFDSRASRLRKQKKSVLSTRDSLTDRLEHYKVLERYLKKRESTAFHLAVENLYSSILSEPFRYHFHMVEDPLSEQKRKRGCRAIYQYLLYAHKKFHMRHIFLLLLLVVYTLIGGAIFNSIESPYEEVELESVYQLLEQKIDNISTDIIAIVSSLNHSDQHMEMNVILKQFYEDMLNLEGKWKNSVLDKFNSNQRTWNFWNAVFYSATLFTTIGYGTIACATNWGKTVTVVYSVIGIPIMLVVFNDLGRVLFFALEKLYNRIYTLFQKTRLCRKVDENDTVDHVFPLRVAIPLVFVYLLICSVVIYLLDNNICMDESGLTFGDSFYFSFISISTIGLGDVMPDHIEYHPLVVVLLLFGLVLLSVINSTIRVRMERNYFRAMEMLEELLENLHAEEIDEINKETRGHKTFRDMSNAIRIAALTAPGAHLEHEASMRNLRVIPESCHDSLSLRSSLSSLSRRHNRLSGSSDINSLMPTLGVMGFNLDAVRETNELLDPYERIRSNFAESRSKSRSDANLFLNHPRRYNHMARRSLDGTS